MLLKCQRLVGTASNALLASLHGFGVASVAEASDGRYRDEEQRRSQTDAHQRGRRYCKENIVMTVLCKEGSKYMANVPEGPLYLTQKILFYHFFPPAHLASNSRLSLSSPHLLLLFLLFILLLLFFSSSSSSSSFSFSSPFAFFPLLLFLLLPIYLHPSPVFPPPPSWYKKNDVSFTIRRVN
jgi:hypothetical protein